MLSGRQAAEPPTGALAWPEILRDVASWSLTVTGESTLGCEGTGPEARLTPTAGPAPPGTCFTCAPADHVAGGFASTNVLASLHAQAARWPRARFVVRLPTGWK